MEDKNKEKLKLYRQLSLLGIIPAILAIGPLLGFFGGKWLDGLLGTEPYLMYLFLVLGFVAAGREIYNVVKRVSSEMDE